MRSVYFAAAFAVAAGLFPAVSTGQTRVGSAFAVANGKLLITNRHVIDGCSEISIADLGRATVVKADAGVDIAILKPSKPLERALAFRAGHQVKLGEEIVVIGYPLRGLLASPPTVTTGIVSSLAGIRDDHTEMQISAPVQPGSSGGPVLDRSGKVVGVVVGKLNALKAAQMTGDIPQNVNFAIHSSIVTSILDSYSLEYDSAPPDKPQSIEDIVATSLPAVVEVRCSTLAVHSPDVATSTEPPRNAAPSPIRRSTLCGRETGYAVDIKPRSQAYARFVGVWTGVWNNASRLCGALVVEKVESDGTADVVYIYGPSKPGTTLAWKRQSASALIRPDGKLFFRDDQGSAFVFEMENPTMLNAAFGGLTGRLTGQFAKTD